MSLPLTAFSVAQIFSKIIEITGFGNNSILFIYHSYHTIKLKHCISNLEWLSLCLLFLNISFGFFLTLSSFSLQPRFLSCKIFTDIISSNYLLTKIVLYSLFLERLFFVFKGTPYSFKLRNIYISRCILLLYILTLIIMVFITGEGYYDPIHDSCYEYYPLYLHGSAACGDLIIGIVTSILFTRRLMLLRISTNNPFIQNQRKHSHTAHSHTDNGHKESSKSNRSRSHHREQISVTIPAVSPSSPNINPKSPGSPSSAVVNHTSRMMRSNSNRKIMNVMMQDTLIWKALNKFTLLTFISVFTTLISLILAGIFELAALWISIDSIVNCWCVLLCFKVHKNLYHIICCGHGDNVICVECLSWYSCHCCLPIVELSKESKNADDIGHIDRKQSDLAKSTKLGSATSKTETQYEQREQAQPSKVGPKLDKINVNLDPDSNGTIDIDDVPEFISSIPTNSYQTSTEIEMEMNIDGVTPQQTKLEPQRSIAGIPIQIDDAHGTVQVIQ